MKQKNFQTQEDTFSKNAQSISKVYHEVLMLMKFLQNKPQVKNMNVICYDLFYTVNKNRDDKEIVNDEYENDFFNVNDFITPNLHNGFKPRETKLK